jgi:uncharacterized integral membrane protein (TIGR00697 family)
MTQPISRIDGASGARRHFRYYDYVMAAFVAILLLSNLIGASKLSVVNLSWLTGASSWLPWHWLGIGPDGLMIFGAGILFFPLSYVIGDVLTEVYGYANARRCVWTGFFALLFMAFMSFVVVSMPPASIWDGQPAYQSVFGNTWRIVIASVLAFWAGEFVNSFVLARMKIWTGGRKLWTRTIGSTFFGQAVDSAIFYPIAFLGVWETETVIKVMITNWLLKVLWEALLTPVTYAVVGWFKAREGVDVYDTGTDFSPFAKSAPV